MWFVNDLISGLSKINLDTLANIQAEQYCAEVLGLPTEYDSMIGQIFLTDKNNNKFKIFEQLGSRKNILGILDYCLSELVKAIHSDKKIIYASDVFNLKNSE